MNNKKSTLYPALSTIIGACLVAVATVLHPIIIDPWPRPGSLNLIHTSHVWIFDHSLMAIGLTCWLVGLTSLSYKKTSGHISSLFTSSLAIWLLILAVELAILPFLAETATKTDSVNLYIVGTHLFAFVLMAGYFGILLIWIGVLVIAFYLKHTSIYPKWFSTYGSISGVLGIAGIIYIFYDSEGIFSILLLGVTSVLPFVWIILFALYTIKADYQSYSK